jgi:hypothetical protein
MKPLPRTALVFFLLGLIALIFFVCIRVGIDLETGDGPTASAELGKIGLHIIVGIAIAVAGVSGLSKTRK